MAGLLDVRITPVVARVASHKNLWEFRGPCGVENARRFHKLLQSLGYIAGILELA